MWLEPVLCVFAARAASNSKPANRYLTLHLIVSETTWHIIGSLDAPLRWDFQGDINTRGLIMPIIWQFAERFSITNHSEEGSFVLYIAHYNAIN